MYYSAGTYESFAHPEKPEGVDKKSAYIIGTGLAGLTAAFYLVRDGQMKGEHIHLLEKLELAGGSCDGRKDVTKGFFMRGGREMDNHFEVMWDMFRDVPSLETPGASVLDEYYLLNKHDPNYSLCRATGHQGEDAHTDKKFGLDKAFIARVYGYIFIGLMLDWIKDDMQQDPKELVGRLATLIKGNIAQGLQRFSVHPII